MKRESQQYQAGKISPGSDEKDVKYFLTIRERLGGNYSIGYTIGSDWIEGHKGNVAISTTPVTRPDSLPQGAENALDQFRLEEPELSLPHPESRTFFKGTFAIWMFILTALSTFWVGMTAWSPDTVIYRVFVEESLHVVRRCCIDNWATGLIFSMALLAILLAHEFGHYCMMRRYGVQSTFPIFIPFPISPFGTCGALIMMDQSKADRRQVFDIGIAGPLAGLVVAIPFAVLGLLWNSTPSYIQPQGLQLGQPLLIVFLDYLLDTKATLNSAGISVGSSNPLAMSAWIGLLITGINMVPISQLDGGHVAFGIFGRNSSAIAIVTFAAIVISMVARQSYSFAPMLVLILLIGLSHPPTSNDYRTIGWGRTLLGLASLVLPILCVPATPFVM